MESAQDASFRTRTRGYLAGALIASGLALIVLIACGVSLSAEQNETELFKKLSLSGDFHPGGNVHISLQWEQKYGAYVEVECDLLAWRPGWTPTPTQPPGPTPTPTPPTIPKSQPTPKYFLQQIFVDTVPPNGQGDALEEATPVPGAFEQDFSAPGTPGRYVVYCFTPKDTNNRIAKDFTIAEPTS